MLEVTIGIDVGKEGEYLSYLKMEVSSMMLFQLHLNPRILWIQLNSYTQSILFPTVI